MQMMVVTTITTVKCLSSDASAQLAKSNACWPLQSALMTCIQEAVLANPTLVLDLAGHQGILSL